MRRVIRYLLLVATTTMIALWTSVVLAAQQAPKLEPQTDEAGNQLYLVMLDEGVAAATDAGDEPPARSTRDPANSQDFRGWHRPNVRKLVKELERDYGVQARSMTSWAMPAFSSYIPPTTLANMERDPRIAQVLPLHKNGVEFSTWSDRVDGQEIVPWGKIAIGADDSITTSNLVYIIDGGARTDHSDLNVVDPSGVGFPPPAQIHATHVAGIIGAYNNNFVMRGVNQGAEVISVSIGNNDWPTAFDWVLADAEQRGPHGTYGVANFSLNAGSTTSDGIAIRSYTRRVSSRVLLVQSAGNHYPDSACDWAYNRTNNWDGIVVVAGVNKDNYQPTAYDNTGTAYQSVDGSTGGPCVDIWAPSVDTLGTEGTQGTSTSANGWGSGTSFAAPHITALAARYGDGATTPVEREQYIYQRAYQTGTYDNSSPPIPIWMASYTASPRFTMPSKLSVSSVSADSSLSGYGPANAVDSNYLTTSWNSGHSAPAWIEFDLGSMRFLSAIRLIPSQTPSGNVVHNIYAGSSPNPTTLLAAISEVGTNLEPFAAYLNTVYARYVRVVTVTSPAWVAWYEIELYGY